MWESTSYIQAQAQTNRDRRSRNQQVQKKEEIISRPLQKTVIDGGKWGWRLFQKASYFETRDILTEVLKSMVFYGGS